MAGVKQKKSVDLDEDDLTRLHRLPRFKGKNFADIIRLLIADAIEGTGPAKPLFNSPDVDYLDHIGFGGVVPAIKHLDFSRAIDGSRQLYLRVPSPSFFLQYRSADAHLLLRLAMAMGSTLIVFCLEESASGDTYFPAHEAHAIEAFLASVKDVVPPDAVAGDYDFHVISRTRSELSKMPPLAVVTENEAFVSGDALYHDSSEEMPHGLNWKRPPRSVSNEYLRIRNTFFDAFDGPPHALDFHAGSRDLLR